MLQEMSEDPSTPKEEKQERLSRHKETVQRSQAEEEAHLLAQQRMVYDRSCRALKRRTLVRRHEFEQEQMREVKFLSDISLTHPHNIQYCTVLYSAHDALPFYIYQLKDDFIFNSHGAPVTGLASHLVSLAGLLCRKTNRSTVYLPSRENKNFIVMTS